MIKEIIEILKRNDVPLAMIESIRNMLVLFEKNKKRCPLSGSCVYSEHSKNTIPDAKPRHNHNSLASSDQILIQIPRGLKISSIQFDVDQERVEPQGRRWKDLF